MKTLFQSVLKSFWDASVDAVVVVDSDGKIVMTNAAVETLLGWTDLRGASVEVLVPEDLRFDHRGHRERFQQAPTPRQMGKASILTAAKSDGSVLPVDISLTHLQHEGEFFAVATVRDASARFDYEEELRRLSFNDALTGLYNRGFLDEEMSRLDRGRRGPIAILVADLDGLKGINDTFGHTVGDTMIVETADALRKALRAEDVIARTGGDEFVALLPGVGKTTAEELRARVAAAIAESTASPRPSVSLGVAVGIPGEVLLDVMRAADANMYRDKRQKQRERDAG